MKPGRKNGPFSEGYFVLLGQKQEGVDWSEDCTRTFHPDVSPHTRSAARCVSRTHLRMFLSMDLNIGAAVEEAVKHGRNEDDCIQAMVDAYLTARRKRPECEVVV